MEHLIDVEASLCMMVFIVKYATPTLTGDSYAYFAPIMVAIMLCGYTECVTALHVLVILNKCVPISRADT